MKWNEKRQQQQQKKQLWNDLHFAIHIRCWQPLTLHWFCVACFIVWIFLSIFISLVSLAAQHWLGTGKCVCSCCCEDEHFVSFLQGNCRNYNRSAFQNQKKKCDCVVYLLSIWLNCLIYTLFGTWKAHVVWQLMLLVLLDCCWLPLPLPLPALYAFI